MIKRDRWKELWVNRPWVYIPEVIRFMRQFPYRKKNEYFWTWLKDAFWCCWEVCLK